ncbi:MAG: hypothetical protein FWE25_10280 [Lachnospiraceae bacterium]|nr:hypothetical protein [Lachnospiraceae bacterium]
MMKILKKPSVAIAITIASVFLATLLMTMGSGFGQRSVIVESGEINIANITTENTTIRTDRDYLRFNDSAAIFAFEIAESYIDAQVVFQNEEIMVTALYLDHHGDRGAELRLLIDNHSNRNINVKSYFVSVNGIMMDQYAGFITTISPNAQSSERLEFSQIRLAENQIRGIGCIALYLQVRDNNGMQKLFDTDLITIQTSIYDEVIQAIPDHAIEVLNQDGVIVYFLGFNTELFPLTRVWFLVENNRERMIDVSIFDSSINGQRVDGTLISWILPDHSLYATIHFSGMDMEHYGIHAIEKMALGFAVYEQMTGIDTLDASWSVLRFNFEERVFRSNRIEIYK